MSRLIDADALIEFIDMGHLRNPLEICFSDRDVVDMLGSRPTIELVRCVNCIHWVTDDLGNHVCAVFDIANSYGEPVATKPDDFCSYGERKEGADNEP